jgi:RNA polymerase sigma-70 factor (ECF subfamily)
MESLNPDRWYEHYADYLRNYARRKLSDEDLVKDIVQDTFLTAFEQIPKFRHSSSERTWLVGILKIKILLAYRKKANERIFLCGVLMLDVDMENRCNLDKPGASKSAVYIEDDLNKKELCSIVLRTVLNFPFTWRAVFISKYIEERSGEEICRALHLTQTQYWKICHRLRVGLRMSLLKAGFER